MALISQRLGAHSHQESPLLCFLWSKPKYFESNPGPPLGRGLRPEAEFRWFVFTPAEKLPPVAVLSERNSVGVNRPLEATPSHRPQTAELGRKRERRRAYAR